MASPVPFAERRSPLAPRERRELERAVAGAIVLQLPVQAAAIQSEEPQRYARAVALVKELQRELASLLRQR